MGGIGKTTLAQHTASVAVDRGWFPGGVVVANLRGYDPSDRRIQPGQVFAPLLYALGMPPQRIPPTRNEQATAYHRHLADLADRKRPVLLILDNASTAEQVLDLLPRQAVHRAVVTTRDTLTLPSTRRVELDVLTRRESLSLLRQAVRQHHPHDTRVAGDRVAGERLVQVCGRLPLAIGIAAALLVDDPDLTTAALADDLADSATRLAVLQHDGTAVTGVIEVSWRHLRERDPDAARLLRLLTLDLGPDISTAAAAALADVPETLVAVQLRTLRQAHLLHTTNGRWRMHDLVRLHIHATHADGDDHHAAVTRLVDYYLTTAEAADNYFCAPSRQAAQTVFTGRLDAEAWLDTHRATLAAAVALATTSARHAVALDLAALVCAHLTRRWDGEKDHLAVARDALTAATELGEPDGRATALDLPGIALLHCGQPEEGDAVLRQALALWQDIGDREGQSGTWNNIGIVLNVLERRDEAIVAYRRSLAFDQDEGDREGEATVSINLAATLRLAARFGEAITQCRRAVDLCQDIGFRDEEGRAWHELDLTLREDEAIDAFHRARIAYRNVDNRDGEGLAWRNLAETLSEMARSQEAIDAYHCAVAAYRDSRDRDAEADAWNSLGLVLFDVGWLDEAVDAHRRAQALWRDIGNRDSEAVAWHNLGVALHHDGRVRTAVAAYRRALALDQETGNRASESRSWRDLSAALSDDNREAEARHARQQAVLVLAERDRQPAVP